MDIVPDANHGPHTPVRGEGCAGLRLCLSSCPMSHSRSRLAARRTAAPVKGALLVAGTTSDAGKTVVTAGIIRWLRRQGISVAPFKAQNMSLNSFVTADGAEIGRAQALQAVAAGLDPDVRMNPVLLKPGADGCQVIVLGQPIGEIRGTEYAEHAGRLLDVALDGLAQLRDEFDVVMCEGAGSPAEINLRDTDIANMGLARAAGLPAIVVADIDRGGAFAALHGTVALLAPEDQRLIAGFVINKFRGDVTGLQPGIGMLRQLTGRQVLGVLPWTEGLWPDAEDVLSLATGAGSRPGAGSPLGCDVLRVSVVRLPRISNFTDMDALSAEPGVLVRLADTPAELADADLVIVPGTRATVADLGWLRERGLAQAIAARARAGLPVLGICGGYQMLAADISDDVESSLGQVTGLGLLPATVTFVPAKTVARRSGSAYGATVTGYEIRHGRVKARGITAAPFPGGCRSGSVCGTSWHGLLENDEFRRSFLTEVAELAGREFKVSPDTSFASVREAAVDRLADLVEEHLDTAALCGLIAGGPPPGLPVLPPGGLAGRQASAGT
jgi:adenosylcobyric acid synthase